MIENWPEASLFVSALLPFRNLDHLIFAFQHYLDQIPEDSKIYKGSSYLNPLTKLFLITGKQQILKMQADLSDTQVLALTAQSEDDLGLPEVFDIKEFNRLKSTYKDKFGFPYVISVQDISRSQLVSSIKRRSYNEVDLEVIIGLKELKKISESRLRSLFD